MRRQCWARRLAVLVAALLLPFVLVSVVAEPVLLGAAGPKAGALTKTGPGTGNRYTVKGSKPSSITTGADGALWFTEWASGKIGRVTVAGKVTKWKLPTADAGPTSIAAGPDGNLWFIEKGIPRESTVHQIGRITPKGAITEFPITARPGAITAGPNGNLWFTAIYGENDPQIDELTTSGSLAAVFPLTGTGLPTGITTGSDGNLWFSTEAGEIGRITPSGAVSLFGIPGGLPASDITAGPTGSLWFTTGEGSTGDYYIGRSATNGTITLYPIPASAGATPQPQDITPGPDGNVWFTMFGTDQIGRVNTGPGIAGQMAEYSVAINGGDTPAGPYGITTGPDGDIWFTDWTAGQVVEYAPPPVVSQTFVSDVSDNLVGVTPGPNGDEWVTDDLDHVDRICSTGTLQQYTLSTYSQPYAITEGPYPHRIGTDVVGIWFTEADANKIGVFPEEASNAVSETCGTETAQQFTIPTAGSKPLGITTGPDGALWFTEYDANQIGRVTTTGTFSQFPIPTADSGPDGIVTGPDGNLWFTEYNADQIGRITPEGVVTEFKIPTADSGPEGITAGPDGTLWFTEHGADKIGRISTAGTVTEFHIPTTTTNSAPAGIVAGPDGNLWFAESGANEVGRVTTGGLITSFTLGADHPSAIAATASGLEVTDDIGADGELAKVVPPTAQHAVILPSGPAPSTITAPAGAIVEWTQLGPTDVAVSDASGMGLFKSTSLFPGSDFSFRFAAAGTYPYAVAPPGTTVPPANGTVKVPIVVFPSQITKGTSLNLITYPGVFWSSTPPPSGYRYDVQVEEPGKTYVTWQKGTKAEEGVFVTDDTPGYYIFRSRLRNTANGAHSNWSPAEEVLVNIFYTPTSSRGARSVP